MKNNILVPNMNCNDSIPIIEAFKNDDLWKDYDERTIEILEAILEEKKGKLEKKIMFSPLSEYGDHMTLKEWLDNVESCGFIDYDGHGNLATSSEVSNISICPSEAEGYDFPKWATHIEWYNR